MDLLLLSNSTSYGMTMFAHAAGAFVEVTAGERVTFVPFALADWDEYSARAVEAFDTLGIEATSAHLSGDPATAILEADVVMMGGGNSFRLLDSLQQLGVLADLAANVRSGRTRYLGASAGTNVACATIRTTNDMPICHPRTLDALGLLPFQINLHYFDVDPASTFMGETRDERIEEFLEENDCPVLAMYEGSWLRIEGDRATTTGRTRLFERGHIGPTTTDADVSPLLGARSRFDVGRRPRSP